MPITKTTTSFTWATGSATSSGTTNPISVTGDYAQQVYVGIVQTGTATTPASFTVQVSPDGGTTWYNLTTLTAGTVGSTTPYQWIIDVPITAESVQVVYSSQAGGTSSSLTAQLGQVTAV